MRKRAGALFLLAAAILSTSACLPRGRGLIVLCAGDSLTERGYPPYLQRILARDGVPARVINAGRSGASSGEYASFLMENEERLREERPDVVLIALGTNDLRTDHDFTPTEVFRRNIQTIIERFRTFRSRGGKTPEIFLSTIPDIPGSARRVEAEVNPVIREIASAADLPVVDIHAVLAGRNDLLPGVHPSPEGYRLMAETWGKALSASLR
jgi:lysophospholipase L1-like esterase